LTSFLFLAAEFGPTPSTAQAWTTMSVSKTAR
jgi:hypothetical protein